LFAVGRGMACPDRRGKPCMGRAGTAPRGNGDCPPSRRPQSPGANPFASRRGAVPDSVESFGFLELMHDTESGTEPHCVAGVSVSGSEVRRNVRLRPARPGLRRDLRGSVPGCPPPRSPHRPWMYHRCDLASPVEEVAERHDALSPWQFLTFPLFHFSTFSLFHFFTFSLFHFFTVPPKRSDTQICWR